jgi:PPOX class probable F420-dependent enzyme
MPTPLPDGLLNLLRRPSPCFIATLMPDGSPQLTQTWVTTDGEHVVINVVAGHQKARNIARDGRVAVNVVDPDNVNRYYAVRGRVVATTTEGGADSIDEISQKYLGMPYPNFTGQPETRLILTVEADKVTSPYTTDQPWLIRSSSATLVSFKRGLPRASPADRSWSSISFQWSSVTNLGCRDSSHSTSSSPWPSPKSANAAASRSAISVLTVSCESFLLLPMTPDGPRLIHPTT